MVCFAPTKIISPCPVLLCARYAPTMSSSFRACSSSSSSSNSLVVFFFGFVTRSCSFWVNHQSVIQYTPWQRVVAPEGQPWDHSLEAEVPPTPSSAPPPVNVVWRCSQIDRVEVQQCRGIENKKLFYSQDNLYISPLPTHTITPVVKKSYRLKRYIIIIAFLETDFLFPYRILYEKNRIRKCFRSVGPYSTQQATAAVDYFWLSNYTTGLIKCNNRLCIKKKRRGT